MTHTPALTIHHVSRWCLLIIYPLCRALCLPVIEKDSVTISLESYFVKEMSGRMWQCTRVSEQRETGLGSAHLSIARASGGPGEKLKEGHKGACFKYSDQTRKG